MKKLKLNMEDLRVESFVTFSKDSLNRGTVQGNAASILGTCHGTCEDTCEVCTVPKTCPNTCGNTCDDPTCGYTCEDPLTRFEPPCITC